MTSDGEELLDLAQTAVEHAAPPHVIARRSARRAIEAGVVADLDALMTAAYGDTGRLALHQAILEVLNDGQPPRIAGEIERDGPVLTNLTDVEPRSIEWMRPQRWPSGKLSLVVGDPGLGKTLVLLDAAARISRGTVWPEGTPAPHGHTLILTAEDGLADTVVPRLNGIGADLASITVLEAIRTKGRERPFSLADDLPHLKAAIAQLKPVAVLMDPLSAYLGKSTDSYKDAEVRNVLHPLAKLAADHNVAIIAVMHLNKTVQMRALYRVSSSIAFTAAARSVFAVIAEEAESERRLFVPLKMNLAPLPAGLAFTIKGKDAPQLEWSGDPVGQVDVEAILRGPGHSGETGREREEVKEFLLEVLKNGPLPVSGIFSEFKAAGIASERTLNRAKRDLGVVAERTGGLGSRGEWQWRLPQGASDKASKAASHEAVAPLAEIKMESQEAARDFSKSATSSQLAALGRAKVGGLTGKKTVRRLDINSTDDPGYDSGPSPERNGDERASRLRALGEGWA